MVPKLTAALMKRKDAMDDRQSAKANLPDPTLQSTTQYNTIWPRFTGTLVPKLTAALMKRKKAMDDRQSAKAKERKIKDAKKLRAINRQARGSLVSYHIVYSI